MNYTQSISGIKKKILIADDDQAILDVMSLMLDDANYEIETTVNGHTVRDVKTYLPDLILLDLWMAGIDGRDICVYLKSRDLTKHIPIIIVSASNDAERIAKEAGADDFMAKPFEMSELLSIVHKYT